MACETGYGKTYATIVMVASVILALFGVGDIIGASMIVDECTYAAGLIPLLLNGLGVVTFFTGILIFYVLGREMELDILFTNIYWRSFKIVTWVLTVLTYFVGVALVAILEVVSNGVEDPGCTGVRSYILFHIFATAAVPFAPVVLVVIALAIALTVLVLYIAAVCLEFCAKATEESNRT